MSRKTFSKPCVGKSPFNAFGCAGKRRRIIGGDERKKYHNVNFETSEVNNTLMLDTLFTISLKHERP